MVSFIGEAQSVSGVRNKESLYGQEEGVVFWGEPENVFKKQRERDSHPMF